MNSSEDSKVTEHVLEHVLRALLISQNAWEVLGLSEQPFPVVQKALKKLMADEYLGVWEGQIFLTDKGLEFCQEKGFRAQRLAACSECQGTGIDLTPLQKIYQQFEEIASHRPRPISDFDQGYLTLQSTFSRIALMIQRGDVENKKVAILGDDDLISIGLALTGFPQSIIVFEMDKRLVQFIRGTSTGLLSPLEIHEHDLRDKLPEEVLGSCDTFLTDPPEARLGLQLFIDRGLGTLKPGEGRAGYFGLTLFESSLNKWQQLQKALAERGDIVITEIIKDFSFYQNWDSLVQEVGSDWSPFQRQPETPWYRSSFYRIETLAGFKPSNPEIEDGELYWDEERLAFSYFASKEKQE